MSDWSSDVCSSDLHIFAEGDQMRLVDGIGDLARRIDGENGIVIARAGSTRHSAIAAHRAGKKRLALLDEVGERHQRIRPLGEDTGKGGQIGTAAGRESVCKSV